MQVWSGNQSTQSQATLNGINAWIFSQPYQDAQSGGDIHYLSSCATGRVTRVVLADISGHGESVQRESIALKKIMHKYINHISQDKLVSDVNKQFTDTLSFGRFATAIALSYYSPSGELTFCNAGHPTPLIYHRSKQKWQRLEQELDESKVELNLPFGISPTTHYEQSSIEMEPGDYIMLYTDSLIEFKPDGQNQLGVDGLINFLNASNLSSPQDIIEFLLEKFRTSEINVNRHDDFTLLLLEIISKGKLRIRHKLLAPWYFIKGLGSGIRQKLPLPRIEWSIRNIGGFFLHRFNQKK